MAIGAKMKKRAVMMTVMMTAEEEVAFAAWQERKARRTSLRKALKYLEGAYEKNDGNLGAWIHVHVEFADVRQFADEFLDRASDAGWTLASCTSGAYVMRNRVGGRHGI